MLPELSEESYRSVADSGLVSQHERFASKVKVQPTSETSKLPQLHDRNQKETTSIPVGALNLSTTDIPSTATEDREL
ncbi:Uncharacterized protein HZ326_29787 [Fusarium oxysporum f. sp. albedinis]|nr:Uncharacterized protein HZ326_29787 [Fusarium oxysporum f. sp. albedinis]